MLSACIICHKKKVKCDLASRNPCSNCTRIGAECIVYTRKRKRYTNSLSPRDSTEPIPENQQQHAHAQAAHSSKSQSPIKPANNNSVIETYRGRDRYLGRHVSFDEAIVTPRQANLNESRLSNADLQLLTEQGAFQLPPKAVQDEYIAAFMQFCYPWTPIVEPEWLDGSSPASYLLLQAVCLAASRVMKQSNHAYGSSADFYRRAKLLFFFGHERDPIISIVSTILLNWYNPVGPETISTDTSGFWLRTAEALAFQIGLHKEPSRTEKQKGLRRRLWWTLVSRDCIISAGVGRPRAINLCDSDVSPLSLGDFTGIDDTTSRLFLAYSSICQLLGDIVECCLRRQLQSGQQTALENALYRWVKQDFRKTVDSNNPHHYSFETRQILVTYFANLIILDRSPTPDGIPSARSFMASSFISGIYKDFLDRDELCRLGPVFAFYALCAGLALIPATRFYTLRDTANEEINFLKESLRVLTKQWGSAFGCLRALHRLSEDIRLQPMFQDEPILVLREEMVPFFEDFNSRLCRQWNMFFNDAPDILAASVPVSQVGNGAGPVPVPASGDSNYLTGSADPMDLLMGGDWEGIGFDWSGSWLLDNNPI